MKNKLARLLYGLFVAAMIAFTLVYLGYIFLAVTVVIAHG